jgi:hypothetical protein
MDADQVKARVAVAIEAVFVNDGLLLEWDVGERTIAAWLASYLKGVFPAHDVDVEYNRHGLDPKKVGLPVWCSNGGERLIIPDIVVHRRGTDHDNLLVIELKKTTNAESRDCDEAKVRAMKRELHYRYGVLIDFPAGLGARDQAPQQRWFLDAEQAV